MKCLTEATTKPKRKMRILTHLMKILSLTWTSTIQIALTDLFNVSIEESAILAAKVHQVSTLITKTPVVVMEPGRPASFLSVIDSHDFAFQFVFVTFRPSLQFGNKHSLFAFLCADFLDFISSFPI